MAAEAAVRLIRRQIPSSWTDTVVFSGLRHLRMASVVSFKLSPTAPGWTSRRKRAQCSYATVSAEPLNHDIHPPPRSTVGVSSRQVDARLRGAASSKVALEDTNEPMLAKWCSMSDLGKQAPTAVLVHGILGSRRNLKSFTRMLLEEHPAWQVLLVDLRAHGDSAMLTQPETHGPPSVDTAASDVLSLLRNLKVFPKLLVGHSFGGKVVMAMAEQFGQRLPRPVSVWVLDTVPGALQGVPSQSIASPDPLPKFDDGACGASGPQADHPRRLIQHLQQLPLPITSRSALVDGLRAAGFSDPIARWVATNLRPAPAGTTHVPHASTAPKESRGLRAVVGARSVHNGASPGRFRSVPEESQGSASAGGRSAAGQLVWSFDLASIAAMYNSYEQKDHWSLLESPPQGLSVDFVRAEHSNFRWSGGDAERLEAMGHSVHLLRGAGHWVHTDNPLGLLKIMEPAFCSKGDVQAIHASYERSKAAAYAVNASP